MRCSAAVLFDTVVRCSAVFVYKDIFHCIEGLFTGAVGCQISVYSQVSHCSGDQGICLYYVFFGTYGSGVWRYRKLIHNCWVFTYSRHCSGTVTALQSMRACGPLQNTQGCFLCGSGWRVLPLLLIALVWKEAVA